MAPSSMVAKDVPLADFIVTDLELLLLGADFVSDFLVLANAIAITTRAIKNLKPYMIIFQRSEAVVI